MTTQTPHPIFIMLIYPNIITGHPDKIVEINSALTPILLKIAIFDILAKFEPIFINEGMEMAKKTEDMLKTIVIAS